MEITPNKEVLDEFDKIKAKFIRYSESWKQNNKLNLKMIMKKDYELILNELMNFYYNLCQKKESLNIILKANLDLKCWNLLTERTSLVIKNPIELKHLGKNFQIIIQNLYSEIIEDLRNCYDFFRNVYNQTTRYIDEDGAPIFISNVLTFMGDVKKLKLMLNKKFEKFQDYVILVGDTKKDANDAIGFFNYALNNNPRNTRVYSNMGYLYRTFLEDHISSAYWFIRALSCVENDMKKIKENLEIDFNNIRKRLQKIDYIVDTNIENIQFMKYDIEYLPTLFYRIIGILNMNRDIDEMEHLFSNFDIIVKRILSNYNIVSDQFKINYEVHGKCVEMILLSIFILHYNLNGLKEYPKESERIIINKDKTLLLNFGIYSHGLVKDLNQENIKPILKHTLNLLIMFSKAVIRSINEDNYYFVEKCLLILFYWFSLNYDMFNLIIDEQTKQYLRFLHYSLRNDPEISKFLMPQTKLTLSMLVEKINKNILPIELTFLGFIPMNRFFELNPKGNIFRVAEVQELIILYKIILIHFLDSFNLEPKNNEEIAAQFFKKKLNLTVKDTLINDPTQFNQNNAIDSVKNKLLNPQGKLPISTGVKKIKSLILLDASNIAMRHGNQNFSSKGIKIAMEFFKRQGHEVLGFLPDYLFRQKDPNSVMAKKRVVPDDLNYLQQLVNEHLIILSPPQDYDDSYCINYAKKHNGFIVTNDLFRDYIQNIADEKKKETERIWVKEKCISYTFNQDEFIPNPDAAFFKEFDIKDYNQI
ncbi:MAG: hypothetical protein MJ252_18015 [archaeon]|nr:hypothetical protein [archaeon]